MSGPCGAAPAFIYHIDSPLPGRGRSFRVNEKNQKVTQGTTFLENPPSLRGEFSYATTFRFPVCCQCNGPMPVLTSAHGSTVGRHCRLCRQRPSRQPAAARLPRGTRHEGLVRVHTCRLVPLDHVPLAGVRPPTAAPTLRRPKAAPRAVSL